MSLFSFAGKKLQACIACHKCAAEGLCVHRDDFEEFRRQYMGAEAVIVGTPVYHLAVPGALKAAIDRLGHTLCSHRRLVIPRFTKVYGFLVQGGAPRGGQEYALDFLIRHALLMKGIPVTPDLLVSEVAGICAQAPHGASLAEDVNLLEGCRHLARRVWEMARLVSAGRAALRGQLPPEYFG